MNVELSIEELVLHGFAPGDRQHIGEAVERELSRLFVEQGVPPSLTQGSEIARLNGWAFEISSSSPAEMVGTRVARTLYEGLSK